MLKTFGRNRTFPTPWYMTSSPENLQTKISGIIRTLSVVLCNRSPKIEINHFVNEKWTICKLQVCFPNDNFCMSLTLKEFIISKPPLSYQVDDNKTLSCHVIEGSWLVACSTEFIPYSFRSFSLYKHIHFFHSLEIIILCSVLLIISSFNHSSHSF